MIESFLCQLNELFTMFNIDICTSYFSIVSLHFTYKISNFKEVEKKQQNEKAEYAMGQTDDLKGITKQTKQKTK